MIWKKTRITTNRYDSGDFRITEAEDASVLTGAF